ncbi:phenylalanine--tRNA ligase beta subunit-related protein [Lipingzhangella sp. LS1_29]|uniref:Phenylalanine--tRNA ligase beta subunit-related protein n=1 Tax=Lipingzhangella rawalii TaxID=2055835 RepID=A0ABU2H1K5_9ACTN|nr:phenylalanine--tRNA ligase beta subunit-related protein [Lipingzhangella rawalii]MDS1269176.1 phenylalanine--tRNA ligase beta subunit-related protein [Lipingzhangella rawalii]
MAEFRHSAQLWQQFPELVAGVVRSTGIDATGKQGAGVDMAAVADLVCDGEARARRRLSVEPESSWPQIRAWRGAFTRMGEKPTRYRCAAEALLRRLRRAPEGLPRIHPLVDVCNALSVAFGIPVAAVDLDAVHGNLVVGHADGTEVYRDLAGAVTRPAAGEVIFADDAARAHARRWTHRQSGDSMLRDDSSTVLVVAEALHVDAEAEVSQLLAELTQHLRTAWSCVPQASLLSPQTPRFDLGAPTEDSPQRTLT